MESFIHSTAHSHREIRRNTQPWFTLYYTLFHKLKINSKTKIIWIKLMHDYCYFEIEEISQTPTSTSVICNHVGRYHLAGPLLVH